MKLNLCPICKETMPRMTGHFQNGMRKAAQKGLIIVEPRSNQLQLDIDGLRAWSHHREMYRLLRAGGVAKKWMTRVTRSRKPDHWHVTITMPEPMPILERIGLAAILGDDPVRAAMNWTRAVNRNKYPVVFFEQEKNDHHSISKQRKSVRRNNSTRSIKSTSRT